MKSRTCDFSSALGHILKYVRLAFTITFTQTHTHTLSRRQRCPPPLECISLFAQHLHDVLADFIYLSLWLASFRFFGLCWTQSRLNWALSSLGPYKSSDVFIFIYEPQLWRLTHTHTHSEKGRGSGQFSGHKQIALDLFALQRESTNWKLLWKILWTLWAIYFRDLNKKRIGQSA